MAKLPSARHRARRSPGAIRVFVILATIAFAAAVSAPAYAQDLVFPQTAPKLKRSPRAIAEDKKHGQPQMLVQANEINYDYTNHLVAAVGNVQIYYGGATIEADKVVYNQTTKRLRAEGNVRLTEEDGKVTYGQIMDLSDNYRDGFVDSLRLDAPDQTRMAAARADRSAGNFTVFHNGVYTACAPCKDDPRKPPLWQVKAARIIHDQNEKMIYFENASLEFFGKPIAYMPYFSAPDPTVKRKTGFLTPAFSTNSLYGVGVEIPYYWALAPDYDVTFAPLITTRQGPLLQGEFRQRFDQGALAVRASGIYQLDKNKFLRSDGTATPGYRDERGHVESSGQFALNNRWVLGWDALAVSDKSYLQNYNPRLSRFRVTDPLQTGVQEGVSQLYLAGKGDRSYFDMRSIYYYGFSESDQQGQIPIVHPVMDYTYTFKNPILGGELGYNLNLTSLSRNTASFDPITFTAVNSGLCAQSADTSVKTPTNCLLRGVPGNYNRFTAETHWKRSITDSMGQVFTPFASVRADVATVDVRNDPGVSNFMQTGDSTPARVMPTVGLEYRYPFINVQSWGTQTVEPIAQVIARPNEQKINSFPNEDAQSLIYDDSNLFRVDKFSGYDRMEGGGRANYGVTYTAQFNQGGFFNALFGQSYQIFGQNSFAQGGLTNTGIGSGLDTTKSDYVARFSYQPDSIWTFTSRFRFDNDQMTVRRTELEARGSFNRFAFSVLYGDYAAQPELGFLNRRQGILGTGQVKLDANWVLLGGARYDIYAGSFDQTRLGLGYVDDCMIFALNYITNYTYSGNPGINHTIMLQMTLRTLGGTSVSQGVGGSGL